MCCKKGSLFDNFNLRYKKCTANCTSHLSKIKELSVMNKGTVQHSPKHWTHGVLSTLVLASNTISV